MVTGCHCLDLGVNYPNKVQCRHTPCGGSGEGEGGVSRTVTSQGELWPVMTGFTVYIHCYNLKLSNSRYSIMSQFSIPKTLRYMVLRINREKPCYWRFNWLSAYVSAVVTVLLLLHLFTSAFGEIVWGLGLTVWPIQDWSASPQVNLTQSLDLLLVLVVSVSTLPCPDHGEL